MTTQTMSFLVQTAFLLLPQQLQKIERYSILNQFVAMQSSPLIRQILLPFSTFSTVLAFLRKVFQQLTERRGVVFGVPRCSQLKRVKNRQIWKNSMFLVGVASMAIPIPGGNHDNKCGKCKLRNSLSHSRIEWLSLRDRYSALL